MAIGDLLLTMSCMAKNVSRATKRLWWKAFPFLQRRKRAAAANDDHNSFLHKGESDTEEEEEEEEGVWKHDILLGEKCKYLNFSGIIHYDCNGRQVVEPRTPRTPIRESPLPSFAQTTVNIDRLEKFDEEW